MFDLEFALHHLPDSPGVYIMYDAAGEVIYVGKAVNLKNRVRSYFHSPGGQSVKVRAMAEKVASFETILAGNELEALVLESNLIKKHRPHYNILLKDDKHYPYIRIDTHAPYPRIEIVRRMQDDKARYFGPYTSAQSMREVLDALRRIFPLRSCKKDLSAPKGKERPCLNFQIGRCLAPCQGHVPPEEYARMVDGVLLFLSGRQEDVLGMLRAQMKKAAEQWDFERAALYRDRVEAAEKMLQKQRAISSAQSDQDVLGVAIGIRRTLIQILSVREGKILGAQSFQMQAEGEEDAADVLSSFLSQHYMDESSLPSEILLPALPPDAGVIAQYLSEKKGKKVHLLAPQRGEKKRLTELAMQNAKEKLARLLQREDSQDKRGAGALYQLAAELNLPAPPHRIECFDNSNFQGADPVASMVVLKDGKPAPKLYRRFKIRTVVGPDDFASMKEVVGRRLRNAKEELEQELPEEKAKFLPLPDLLLIDGGRGQLGAAVSALEEAGLSIPVFGLAKRYEELFAPGADQPIRLPKISPALHLLQRARDEAHRFAITYHRSLLKKGSLHSQLEEIPGVGEKRRRELFLKFRSVEAIRAASVEDLSAARGMTRPAAQAVYDFFHPKA